MNIHAEVQEFTADQLDADPILRYFHYAHLPIALQAASRPFCDLAEFIINTVPRNPERSAALRKLLEAKDAAVRANLPPLQIIQQIDDEDAADYPVGLKPAEDRSTDGIAAAIEEASDKLADARLMPGQFFSFAHRSSNIEYAVWDGAKMELLVCFKTGSNNLYYGVDEETWRGLKKAESAGKYLAAHVISQCRTISVDRDGNPI